MIKTIHLHLDGVSISRIDFVDGTSTEDALRTLISMHLLPADVIEKFRKLAVLFPVNEFTTSVEFPADDVPYTEAVSNRVTVLGDDKLLREFFPHSVNGID